ncbi:hypothetical protein NL357_18945 [Klebsiella pneumoniae]|nr:hypothetical protein [Klebsiella pneumoniae]
MSLDMEEVQSVIDAFDRKMMSFFKAHDVTFEIKSQQDKQGLHWNNYTFKLRNDLPDYGLKFDDAQGIFSYCTTFKNDFLGASQATFGGLKRLVIFPPSPANIRCDTDPEYWYFISKNSEIDRFISFLLVIKSRAKIFFKT